MAYKNVKSNMLKELIININKAIKNRQSYLVVFSTVTNTEILRLLYNNGYIQSVEKRGHYTIIHLKHIY